VSAWKVLTRVGNAIVKSLNCTEEEGDEIEAGYFNRLFLGYEEV
jgi:hypothetical protein